MQIDSAIETRDSWAPLEKALSRAQCVDFMWMGAAGTIQLYKHMDTRRYLLIDATTGLFYDDRHNQLSREAAIAYVLSA
jgi:hypothetical protein